MRRPCHIESIHLTRQMSLLPYFPKEGTEAWLALSHSATAVGVACDLKAVLVARGPLRAALDRPDFSPRVHIVFYCRGLAGEAPFLGLRSLSVAARP